jgi:hypothetical protein
MDFSKYDPIKPKPLVFLDAKPGLYSKILLDESKLTPADYDDHANAPGKMNAFVDPSPGSTEPKRTVDFSLTSQDAVKHEPYMTSTSVILLVECLRKYQDKGIILFECDGKPGLRFKPGINKADIENGRAIIAMQIYGLLMEAREDLQAMIAGGIDVPFLTHRQSRKKVK